MANYSRWEDIKKNKSEPSAETRAGVDQDLDLGLGSNNHEADLVGEIPAPGRIDARDPRNRPCKLVCRKCIRGCRNVLGNSERVRQWLDERADSQIL